MQTGRNHTPKPLAFWEIVFHHLESSVHFDRLGKFHQVVLKLPTYGDYGP